MRPLVPMTARVRHPQGPPSLLEDLSLSTRMNQGSGGGQSAGDGGPWEWRAATPMTPHRVTE